MYLIDSNVLIEAKNRYYAFDIAPGFWIWLEQAHAGAEVCSIDKVREELLEGDDELAGWARNHPGFFRAVDQSATEELKPLSQWASTRDYTPAAIAEFIGNTADYYLIAYAKAHGHEIVTHEQSSPQARKRVLIPDACLAMGVTTCDTFQMLRRSNARFHFQRATSSP